MIEIIAQAADLNVTEAIVNTAEQAIGIAMNKGDAVQDMYSSIQGGLGCLGAAIGVGIVGMKGAEAVGRNPDAAGAILVQSIIGMALAEAVAFYSLFL